METKKRKGSLVVVGTGIKLLAHVTLETRQLIEQAERVLYVVADPVVARWIESIAPNARCLNELYSRDKLRRETYEEMVEATLEEVRDGRRVCAIFYGHPGVFVYPSHKAVWTARREGYEAYMTPGISAEDCLFSDVGLDPSRRGCQSYEATNFLVRRRIWDPRAALILWQVGVIGDRGVREPGTWNTTGVRLLVEVLREHYPHDHAVVVYEAAQWPIYDSRIDQVPLDQLVRTPLSAISTLYVPPLPDLSFDRARMNGLGMDSLSPRPSEPAWGILDTLTSRSAGN